MKQQYGTVVANSAGSTIPTQDVKTTFHFDKGNLGILVSSWNMNAKYVLVIWESDDAKAPRRVSPARLQLLEQAA